ncbi:hypothetical protein ACLB2K_066980 [Fragaria x ananassa]
MTFGDRVIVPGRNRIIGALSLQSPTFDHYYKRQEETVAAQEYDDNAHLVFNDLIEAKYVLLDYKIPSKEELKDKKYCTIHNVYNYDTKDCVKLQDQLQTWLKSGALKMKTPESIASLVDVDPFPSRGRYGRGELERPARREQSPSRA